MRATLGRCRATATVSAVVALGAAAPARADVPVPEGGFAPVQLAHEPCQDRTYPECRRLRFTYGPLPVTPGNNAQSSWTRFGRSASSASCSAALIAGWLRPSAYTPNPDKKSR